MTYKPSWIANTFLQRGKEDGIPIDHLKMQKLVYCLHGWHLAVRNEPAVGELFEAWKYGPVLSSLYRIFNHVGKKDIEKLAIDIDTKTGEPHSFVINREHNDFGALFEAVWNRYKDFSGLQLSSITHAKGTPWTKARERGDTYLSDKEIRQHFVDLAMQSNDT